MATRQTKNNAAAAPQEAAPQMPEGLELNGLGNNAPDFSDFPADDAKLAPEQANAKAEAESYGRNKYAPSQGTIDRLNALPHDEIKKELGIDIPHMMKSAVKYGMLEALAYGTFTPPLKVYVGMPHQKRHSEYASIRLWNMPAKEGREARWGYDMHRVTLKNKVDENGNVIYNKNGQPEKVYDRNPIKPGDILIYGTTELSPEQVDRVRLTGNLGEPLTVLDYNNRPSNVIISVNPYNNHELIGAKAETVAKRLEKMPEYKYSDREGVSHVYKLSDRAIGELSMGRGVWLKPAAAGDKDIFVQYNAASDRLERATSYEQAKRKELEVEHGKAQAQNAQKSQVQEMSAGMHL